MSRCLSFQSGGPTIATVEHAAPRAVVATEALYRRHSQRVWRYCLRSLRRPADAEDAVQQTFLQAHRALQGGVEPVSETDWLLTIARNVCLTRADASRRRDRAEVTEDAQLLDEIAWADDADDAISAEVQAAFAELPERQRQALFLREWQGCSYAEIAKALGASESAVETLLFRARRTLVRTLDGPRRRAGEAVGLLGWMRLGFGPGASKVAVAVVAATAAGSGVVVERHSQSLRAHPAAVVAGAPRAERARRPAVASRAVHRHVPRPGRAKPWARTIAPVAAAPAAPEPAPAPAPPEQPTQAPEAPAPAPSPAPPASELVAAAADPTPPATVATTVTTVAATATAAASSVLDSAAQTVSTATAQAAPAVDAAAQTVDGAVQTVANTADSAEATVAGLLGN